MNEDDIRKFPTYEEAKNSVERLKKLDWPKFEKTDNLDSFIKDVKDIIYSEFELIPNFLRMVKPSQFLFPIFRVRELNSIKNKSLFSEHTYPPPNLATIGRCNFPKNPVFYCSNEPMTAIAEVVRNNDYRKKQFCISKWKIAQSQGEIAFQNFLSDDLTKENVFSELVKIDRNQLDIPFQSKLDSTRKAGVIEFLNFLHGLFISDENMSTSASLAHSVLYAKHNLATDILMYPSIQAQFKGVNMAIHPNFVDNQMQLERLYVVEIKDLNLKNEIVDVRFIKYAYIDKNVLMWRSIEENDKIFEEYLKLDFKQFLNRKYPNTYERTKT